MLTETMLENAKKLNASVEGDLIRIKSNTENSKQPDANWSVFVPDVIQSKLTEQIDRVMARSANELNRLEEDINIELETIRVKCEDTLLPLLRAKDIDKMRSGQFWFDTAFKFVSMASISDLENEYKRAVADKNIDYATGLIHWSVLKFKEGDEKKVIKNLKAEHTKIIGLDMLADAKRLLMLSLEDISNFRYYNDPRSGYRNINEPATDIEEQLKRVHEARAPQIKQELLNAPPPAIW